MEENKILNDIDESAIWSDIENAFRNEPEILHFCEDLKVISELELDDAGDSVKSKEKSQKQIHKAVERLIGFVEKRESANPAVNDMFGFALDKKNKSDSNWKEYLDDISQNSRKQYLFFMADMKIKATVYYLRIHNFITHNDFSVEQDASNNALCDKKYYLFDNSMREVCFTGIGWKRLWRYDKGTADLFRCSDIETGDTFSFPSKLNSNGRVFYQNMIKNIVDHMNKGDHPEGDKSAKLASYSKSPFRDIYKYLLIGKNVTDEYRFKIVYENEEMKASLEIRDEEKGFRNNNKRFLMVKNATTNYIVDIENVDDKDVVNRMMILNGQEKTYHITGDSKSFTEFIVGEPSGKEHIFCVDVLNNIDGIAGDDGDRRNLFQQYTSQFPEVDVKGLVRAIVAQDDDEVVMLGNTCTEIHNLTENDSYAYKSYDDFENNHEYRIELNGKDILQLFAYIRYVIMRKDKLDKECISYDKTAYLNLKIGQYKYHCELPKREHDQNIDEVDAEEEVKNAVLEAVKRECEPLKENGQWNWNWKVRIIGYFLEKYHKDNGLRGLDGNIYKSDTDAFINTCRELYLKR